MAINGVFGNVKRLCTVFPDNPGRASYMTKIFGSIVLIAIVAAAQVTVHINSGNPAYPFPQFNPYNNQTIVFGNLGTRTSVGVPHAEMEKTIREAYVIMMNRLEKTGQSLGGIDYLYFNSPRHCSEGDGYGMLGAVAMADKTTFDGLWLWVHDNVLNKTTRYIDCKESAPEYPYSQLPAVYHTLGENSAADGDFDIAMALLLAYRQWGEFMGIEDACGNQVSYKQAAIDFLTALSDTLTYVASGTGLLSGDIGLDGYFKGGDSWGELSGWATSENIASLGLSKKAEQPGPMKQYFDYTAPSYFHAFAAFLAETDSVHYAWNIFQFRRAEASSDWLIGKLYQARPDYLPVCGNVSLTDTTPSFNYTGDMGEDFRLGWRTILNCLWYGNPTSSWNPVTHLVDQERGNTDELNMARRYAAYLWDSRQAPWNQTCHANIGSDPFTYWGPMMLATEMGIAGARPDTPFYFLNWIPSVGSPSAIVSQNYDLMSELYRYLEVEWDVELPGDGYLTSKPVYYHGWYRLLGLLILSGNYPAPADIRPVANTKVYLAIDKTFAFEKDTVTYTIDYRNYGSVDATGTTIVDTLHSDFSFVAATGGGIYNNVTHTVTWNLGTLPGFKTATGITPATGQVQLKVVIANATVKQYRNRVTISCVNGSGWTSNDYPNNVTSVMERNHLDIARRALMLDYSASKTVVKPGDTVEFTIDFENSSDAGWINGGRPGVSFSFAQRAPGGIATQNYMFTRFFHDAAEAYIDFGNYRISYFLYDEKNTCIANKDGGAAGWSIFPMIVEGIDDSSLTLKHETIVPGQDSCGKWNQRLIVQFSDPENPARKECLSTIDRLLRGYYGSDGRIHKGGREPLRCAWYVNSSTWEPVNWGDAWSWDPDADDKDDGNFYPVTNDWSDPDKPDIPVDHWNRKACTTATKTIDNILVEEWDGYTWRRVAGNGPVPGREANNVVIRDTIPDGFSFVAFTGENPMGVAPAISGKVVSWTVPKIQIREGGTLKFTVKADGECPETEDREVVNRAWISADRESPLGDSSIIAISCDTVIKPPPPDHIDIVLDTLLMDMNSDKEFIRITMDEGTQHTVVYAVVRDRNGKFIRTVGDALWISRDTGVVSVSSATCQGVMVKAGGGATIVTVSEPASSGLKPDSLAITTVETPPWPVISNAVMGDVDGNIIPDLLTFTVNDTFHVRQKLDSVIIAYRGSRITFPAASVQVQKTLITVPVTGLLIADPTPAGTVTMVMTVEGSEKRATKTFTDGVGPALSSVSLRQDISGVYDTLDLTFTEDIVMQTLVGRTLQLIKEGGDTVLLTVVTFKGPEFYSETKAVVTTPVTGSRPQEGDLIRLIPGVAGGTVADMKKNLPHQRNRPVMIPERPSQLLAGRYTDENADGIVDAVYLQFMKPVQIDGISVSIVRDLQRYERLSGATLSYGAGDDKTIVKVTLPVDQVAAEGVKTDGAMYSLVTFTNYVGEERTMKIADNAAPVIAEAVFKAGTSFSAGVADVDSLMVTFSEEVHFGEVSPLFLLKNGAGAGYSMTLGSPDIRGRRVSFAVMAIDGDCYPENGDMIHINPQSAVRDSGTWQNNPDNRWVILTIGRGKVKWDVVVAPNPFNPETGGDNAAKVRVKIVNPLNSAVPVKLTDLHISICDATGNVVVKPSPFAPTASGPVFSWDGTNRKGRKVGNGTYIGIVTVGDGGSEGVKKVKIGVLRRIGNRGEY